MNIVRIAAGALLAIAASSAPAVQIVLTAGSVVGSSGAFGSNFSAVRVVNQQSGAVSDSSGNYWLNPDNTGLSPVYITIDLGASYALETIDLFNTHNNTNNDRGTGSFRIVAGSAVADLGGGNMRIAGGEVIVASSLLAPFGTPPAQTFAVASSNSFRYLSFEPLSVSTPSGQFASATSYGLNEIRVFASAVPDLTSTEHLMIGSLFFAGIFAIRRNLVSSRGARAVSI